MLLIVASQRACARGVYISLPLRVVRKPGSLVVGRTLGSLGLAIHQKEYSMKNVAILVAVAIGSAATLVAAAPGTERAAMVERLRGADTNGDGLISRAEAAALPRLAEKFDQIDTNHDGQLSRDELSAFRKTQRAKLVGDTDGDGKVSRAEFMAKAAERFDRLDANQDGFITPDEMRAARQGHGHHGDRS
jgi:hypothetical protein